MCWQNINNNSHFDARFFFITAQARYNAQRAGITSAIVLAVLIPLGICGFCLILTLRERAAEKAVAK